MVTYITYIHSAYKRNRFNKLANNTKYDLLLAMNCCIADKLNECIINLVSFAPHTVFAFPMLFIHNTYAYLKVYRSGYHAVKTFKTLNSLK